MTTDHLYATLGAAGEGGDAGGLAALPNGYVSWSLTRDLYVGVGLGAPFGLKTEYDDQWIGAAQSTLFEVKTYNINPSIAYRVNDNVSLGFGVNWQRLEASYERVAATLAPTVPVVLQLNDDSWGWNAGALFAVSPSTKVGLSYRSAIKHNTQGTLDINNVWAADAKASLELPSTTILSITHQLTDKWQMLGDVSRTGWSSIPKVDIMDATTGSAVPRQTLDTDFKDAWRFALGANYRYDDAWKLKFGLAYDETPVKRASTRLVSMPDNDRVWVSFGTEWAPNKVSTLDLGLSYIFIRDSKIDNNQGVGMTLPRRGRVTGDYSGNIWILGAQYSMSF